MHIFFLQYLFGLRNFLNRTLIFIIFLYHFFFKIVCDSYKNFATFNFFVFLKKLRLQLLWNYESRSDSTYRLTHHRIPGKIYIASLTSIRAPISKIIFIRRRFSDRKSILMGSWLSRFSVLMKLITNSTEIRALENHRDFFVRGEGKLGFVLVTVDLLHLYKIYFVLFFLPTCPCRNSR